MRQRENNIYICYVSLIFGWLTTFLSPITTFLLLIRAQLPSSRTHRHTLFNRRILIFTNVPIFRLL